MMENTPQTRCPEQSEDDVAAQTEYETLLAQAKTEADRAVAWAAKTEAEAATTEAEADKSGDSAASVKANAWAANAEAKAVIAVAYVAKLKAERRTFSKSSGIFTTQHKKNLQLLT